MNQDGILNTREIGLDLANQLLEAVQTEARDHQLLMAAAVVDRSGRLVAAARMDGTPICGIPIAMDKAYTAVAFAAPTDEWALSTQPGGADWGMSTALGGRMVVYPGGLPVIGNGEPLGGLGVSGGTGYEDKMCALSALQSAGLAGEDE